PTTTATTTPPLHDALPICPRRRRRRDDRRSRRILRLPALYHRYRRGGKPERVSRRRDTAGRMVSPIWIGVRKIRDGASNLVRCSVRAAPGWYTDWYRQG